MDEIDIVGRDHRVISQDIRAAVDAAIEIVADETGGWVDIGRMRPHLPPWATGPQVGARITAHVRTGVLIWDGHSFSTNGNRRHRNGARPVKVYWLAGNLPKPDARSG